MSKKSAVPKTYRQGDVLLTRVASAPKHLTPVPRDEGRVILAYGEVTGHAHRIERADVAQLARDDASGAVYLTIDELTAVVHEEHGAIALEPGVYQVKRQREWTDADEPRQVAD